MADDPTRPAKGSYTAAFHKASAEKSKLDGWIWRLIFAGIFVTGLGFAVERQGEPLGWAIVGIGVGSIVVGIALIFVRARTPTPKDRGPA